jgi:hypothetical protein
VKLRPAYGLFLLLTGIVLSGLSAFGQTIIFQSGFEPGDPAFTYAAGTQNTPTQGTTGGNSAPYCGTFASNGKYDGAFITGTSLNLLAGKYYQVNLTYKVATCGGSLKAYRSITGASYANITGGTLLNTTTTNQVNYTSVSFVFTVPVNSTNFIGFVSTMTSNGCNSANFWIDDITVTEYDYAPCLYYCPQGGTSAGSRYISNVTLDAITRTSGWDGYACTGLAASLRRTLTYTLQVTTTTSAATYYSAAWIDWNGNGSFADAGETVMTDAAHPNVAGASTRSISITVPAGAVLGTTKMRVKVRYNSSTANDPCQTPIANDDVEDYDINILPAPVPMVYTSTSVTQITSNVNAGSTRNEVLRVNVFTTGQLSAPSVTQLVFTTLGTTSVSDILNARVFFTGSSNIFSSTTQVGSTVAVPPADPASMTFALSQVLSEGDNYFWITYDVAAPAPGGNVIDAKLSSVKVNSTTYAINSSPAGNRPIIASFPMSYVSAKVVQNSNPVAVNSTDNDVIRIEVVTSGAINPLTATDFTFRITGTTNAADIQNARLYYTADAPVFSTATQFGSTVAAPPASPTNFTISGSTPLVQGTNYFWLAYDVKSTAACNPAQIDGLCNNIVISAVSHAPVPSAPIGARVINCGTAYYSQCTCDLNNPANWNTKRDGSGSALGSTAAFATSSNSFYVQNGHKMTASANLTMSNLYLEPGSYVLTNYLLTLSTLYIEAFATFEQTYSQTDNTIAGTYIGGFYIKKDGTWKHNNNGWLPGTSATQYFEPYSIQWFLGVGAGTFPGGTAWGTVIIDIPNAPNLIINAGSITYVHGNLEIRRWGSSTNYFYINYDNPIYVDGDLIVSGGVTKGIAGFNCAAFCNCNATASAIPVEIAGNFIMSGGTWNDYNCGSNSSTGMAMKIGGNVDISGGTINMNNNAGSTLHLIPVTASTTWSQTGGSVTLGNSWIDAGKTVAMTGLKLGDVAASRTFTVSTGATLNCSNYPVTGGGAFTLATGATLGIGSAAGITSTLASGNVLVTGARSYNSGATYRYYEGLTPQITGNFVTTTTSGTYPAQVLNLIMDKAAPSDIVNLTNTTDVTGTLTLTNGILTSSYVPATAPWIRIPSAATVSPVGGSVSSYVDGYIRRQGATSFIYPTGNGGRWRRIEMTAPSVSTEFEARYVLAPYANTTLMAPSPVVLLDHVSKIEHWYLSKPLGADAATVKVKLYWEDASLSGIYKFDSLTVARWAAAGWEDANCYTGCPANWTTSTVQRTYTGSASGSGAGTIQSNTVSSFSPFTFASIGIYPQNPLPIELLNFDARCDGDRVTLRWTTASEINNQYFTLEKSRDGIAYTEIATVEGAGNSTSERQYAFTDVSPYAGTSYYRLSQTDFDGHHETFAPVTAKCDAGGKTSVYVYNNQHGAAVITTESHRNERYRVTLCDALGKRVRRMLFDATDGINRFYLDITGLAPGLYVINVAGDNVAVTQKLFVQ